MSRLLETSGLFDPLAERIADGMPVFGTCAGMILLATEVLDGRPDQRSFARHRHRRAAQRLRPPGRQLRDRHRRRRLDEPFHAVFIRAPKVESVGGDVEVLASHDGVPVLARQGNVIVASFHPELTGDARLHAAFLHRHIDHGGRRMSGHSKWATIKHKKGAVDKARGKLFNKIARQLEVAARDGGGDPTSNASLRTVILKAKAAQMTNDAIDRAVKRGTGEADGGTYEAITYEGYAPGGVGAAGRRAHRQPQPHRLRGAQRVLQARRVDGRAGRGRLAVQPAWRRPRARRRRGHGDDGCARRRRRRRHGRR